MHVNACRYVSWQQHFVVNFDIQYTTSSYLHESIIISENWYIIYNLLCFQWLSILTHLYFLLPSILVEFWIPDVNIQVWVFIKAVFFSNLLHTVLNIFFTKVLTNKSKIRFQMLSKELQSGPNVVYYVYWRRSRNGETNLEFQSVCLIKIS